MTSCSDAVPSVIRQRPGISSGGLWERNKPSNYSSKGLFENMLALFPSTCAFFLSVASLHRWKVWSCKMLLFNFPCEHEVRWQSWAVAKSVAAAERRVSRLSARDHGSRVCLQADWWCECTPSAPVQSFIGLIYGPAERPSEWPAWLSTEARKKSSGGNHHSTSSPRERVASETASAFLQKISHPGLMRHEPYPVFLPRGTKPPLIRH